MRVLFLRGALYVSLLFLSVTRTEALTIKFIEKIRLPSYLSTNMEPPTIFHAGTELWFIFNIRNSELLELQKRDANDLKSLLSRHRAMRPDADLRFFALRKSRLYISGLSDHEGITEFIFDLNLTPLAIRRIMEPESIPGPCNGSSGRLVLYVWNPIDSVGLFTRARPCDSQRPFEANLFSPSIGVLARTRNAISNIFVHDFRRSEYLFHTNDRMQLLGSRLEFRSRAFLRYPSAIHRIVYNSRENIYVDVASDDQARLEKYDAALNRIPGSAATIPLGLGEFVNQAFHNPRTNHYFLAIPEIAGHVSLRIVALNPGLKSSSNSFRVSGLQFADVQSLTLKDGTQMFLIWEQSGPVLIRLSTE